MFSKVLSYSVDLKDEATPATLDELVKHSRVPAPDLMSQNPGRVAKEFVFFTNPPQPIFQQLALHWSTDGPLGAPDSSPLSVLELRIQNPIGLLGHSNDRRELPQFVLTTILSPCFLPQGPSFQRPLQCLPSTDSGSPDACCSSKFLTRS